MAAFAMQSTHGVGLGATASRIRGEASGGPHPGTFAADGAERGPSTMADPIDPGNQAMLSVQAGDRLALQRLVAMYNGKLFSFVVRIVGDATTAEDIVQETWLSLYERRASYRPTHRFSTWLFTIARRKALSELRRRNVRSIVRSLTKVDRNGGTHDVEFPQQMFCDPDASANSAIVAGLVEQALASLTPQQREIVMLRDIEGFENEEIAEILQWTLKPGAIRKRVFDAREAFRRAMIDRGFKEE